MKVKRRDAAEEEISIVKSTFNKSICSQKISSICEVSSESLEIPDLSTSLLGHVSNKRNRSQTRHQGSSPPGQETGYYQICSLGKFDKFFTLNI